MSRHDHALASYTSYMDADPSFLVLMPHGTWQRVGDRNHYVLDGQYGYYVEVAAAP